MIEVAWLFSIIQDVQKMQQCMYWKHSNCWIETDVWLSACVPKSQKLSHTASVFLRSIRRSESHSVFQSLVAALVLTKLDLGNATLAGIPSFQLHCLQAVVNAAAQLVFQSSRHDHITLLLYCLHWLRAPERIASQLALLVYQCVHGLAPAYLADARQPVAGLPGRQRLRSSSTSAPAVLWQGFPRSATEHFPSLWQVLRTVCHQKQCLWTLKTMFYLILIAGCKVTKML